MMTWLEALVLGLIQGLTEFCPLVAPGIFRFSVRFSAYREKKI